MDQQALASHLSGDFSGPQRKDIDLLERMRKKYGNSSSPATFNSISPTPQGRASISSRRREEETDWEERALQGIRTKELGLDRQWNELSWKQKSSCHERLKLLKDDGVDITPLLSPRPNSDAIVRALMAQVDHRKRQRASNGSAQPAVNGRTASPKPPSKVVDSPRPPIDPLFDHLKHRPLSTHSPKRKRPIATNTGVIDPTEPHTLVDENEPAFKKRCTMDLRLLSTDKPEEEEPTWDLLKTKVLRDLYLPINPTGTRKSTISRMAIHFPSQSSAPTTSEGLVLNSKGYDNIMMDLRVLGGPEGDDGNFGILDPLTDTSTRIITSESRRTIIEGNTDFLIALITRFRTEGKGLLHIAKRYFDENGVRQGIGEAYELGVATKGELRMIEEKLRKGLEEGEGIEVDVGWKYVGKTGTWPKVMY